ATGFVARTESLEGPAARRTIVAKDAVPASKFVESNSAWRMLAHRRCSSVICHVRLATHGSPQNPLNNHPHTSDSLSLVHNGVLASHDELTDKYCLRLESECDSEILLRIVERAKTVPVGLSLCLLERPGAIVVFDESRDVCWLAHDDSRPLWVARMKNDRRLFIGSTSGILIDGIQTALGTAASFDILMPLASNYVFCASSAGTIGAVFEEPVRRKATG